MTPERDLELLDDYLANKLSDADRASLEKRIEADPSLKNEFLLQQSLIKSIQNARAAELKAMLNNVPVPPVHQGVSTLGKVAIGTFVVGAIATGIYFFFKGTNEPQAVQQIENQATVSENGTSGQSTQTEVVQPKVEEPTVNNNKETESKAVDSNKTTPKVKASEQSSSPTRHTQAQEGTPSKQPALNVFDPSEEAEAEATPNKQEDVLITRDPKERGSSIAVDVDKQNKKYNFHYQFKNDKLFLYGPFEENLYEIMEFFGDDDKRTIFLYYKDGYYLLKEDNDKIKPLNALTDQVLIRKLKEYRGN